MGNYLLAQLDQLPGVPCPCGVSRRAFGGDPDKIATVHYLEIRPDNVVHYHKKLTEIYIILEGSGHLELDGAQLAVNEGIFIGYSAKRRQTLHRVKSQTPIFRLLGPRFAQRLQFLTHIGGFCHRATDFVLN